MLYICIGSRPLSLPRSLLSSDADRRESKRMRAALASAQYMPGSPGVAKTPEDRRGRRAAELRAAEPEVLAQRSSVSFRSA
jgi:hypothetical protein